MAYPKKISTIMPYSQWQLLLYKKTVIFNRIAIFFFPFFFPFIFISWRLITLQYFLSFFESLPLPGILLEIFC